MAFKLYGIAYGFDTRAVIKAIIEKILQFKWLSITLYIDLKSLYNCLVKLKTTQEKQLIVNLIYLQQLYKKKEIAKIKWIDGGSNFADVMIKSKPC